MRSKRTKVCHKTIFHVNNIISSALKIISSLRKIVFSALKIISSQLKTISSFHKIISILPKTAQKPEKSGFLRNGVLEIILSAGRPVRHQKDIDGVGDGDLRFIVRKKATEWEQSPF